MTRRHANSTSKITDQPMTRRHANSRSQITSSQAGMRAADCRSRHTQVPAADLRTWLDRQGCRQRACNWQAQDVEGCPLLPQVVCANRRESSASKCGTLSIVCCKYNQALYNLVSSATKAAPAGALGYVYCIWCSVQYPCIICL
jgi:hypothetical protein